MYDFIINQKNLNDRKIFKIHIKFLIFLAKSKVLIKLFNNALNTSENDLFNKNSESEEWKLI